MPWTAVQGPYQRFARNCATRSLTQHHNSTLSSASYLRGRVGREVLHGGVNRRIEGKDGIAGRHRGPQQVAGLDIADGPGGG
jgi:hypothetical protein